jgi:cold shock CspA family protein
LNQVKGRRGGKSRLSGAVVKIDRVKGFGFIQVEGGIEYFFHATAVSADQLGGFDAIQVGDIASFIPDSTLKGPRGFQVLIEEEGA